MLTKKQYQLLLFIDQRLKASGVSPSFDEMKEALDLKSKSGIHRLITGKFSSALPGVLTADGSEAVSLPLYGKIAAGTPIEALRDPSETIDVPAAMLGSTGEHYALQVEGDSMIDAGILDGDVVVIRRSENADNGTIVVALVDNTEVTLKRLRRKGDSIALEPANPRHKTRIFGPDRVTVQGRLIALMRNY